MGYKSSGKDLVDRLSGNILAVFDDFSWNNGSSLIRLPCIPGAVVLAERVLLHVGATQQITT
jgi:hypothetical protein